VESADLFGQILLVTVAGFLGGMAAYALKLPTIVGFLVAGILIGPHTPGPVGSVETIEEVADLGVILLMFGLGVHVSFRELFAMGRVALGGGAVQVALVTAAGFGSGLLLGLEWEASLVVGFAVSISSTAVMIKVLESRHESGTLHGKSAVAVALFQDLAVVLMIVTVPALGGEGFAGGELALAMVKGALLLGATYLLATRALPRLWRLVAATRHRELSLLASISLAVGLASLSGILGLSVAFGAFLAGLAVSESEYGFRSLAEVMPLRDVFATLFFVAMGMLIVPDAVITETGIVLAVVGLAVVLKSGLTAVTLRALSLPLDAAVRTGLVLAQMGEFSFVLVRAGLDEGVLAGGTASAVLAATGLTVLLNPAVMLIGEPVVRAARRVPVLGRAIEGPLAALPEELPPLDRHVVICGFGGVGASLARALAGRNLPYVAVDLNPFVVEAARSAGLPCIYGDGTQPEVLERCNVGQARILAVTFPGLRDAQVAVMNARLLNPKIDVITRGVGAEARYLHRQAGASEVVDSEFEAALEFVRHVLHRYGVDAREIAAMQARRRLEHGRE
jgi:CPA2 family monovalent cation:H+ antiporter-2